MFRRHSPIAVALVAATAVLASAMLASAGPAAAMETSAREAILMDYDTGQILFSKDADQPMPPASMTQAASR